MAQRGRDGENGTDFFPALISVSLDEGGLVVMQGR